MTRMLALAALLGLAGAAQAQESLRICVEGAYPPFSEINDQGEVVGFDVDIANALCEEMGVSCEMVQTEWDAIIPALEARKCDAIVASMSITPERQQRIDFTNKYYQTPARFVVPAGDTLDTEDPALGGARVCAQRGSVHQGFLEGEFPEADIALYPTQDEVYLDLAAGRCDTAMQDSFTALHGFLETPAGEDFEFYGPSYSIPEYHGEGIGIGVRKSDGELRERLNQAIAGIRESGAYQAIQDKYFDFDVYGK